jgi:hypothetical protein
MKKISIILTTVLMTIMMAVLAGCGKKTLDGDWIIRSETDTSGVVMTREELEEKGVVETYHIEGDVATYNCTLLGNDITFDLDIVDKGDGKYDFMVNDFVFQSVTLSGDIFSYVTGEGEDAVAFVFERVK